MRRQVRGAFAAGLIVLGGGIAAGQSGTGVVVPVADRLVVGAGRHSGGGSLAAVELSPPWEGEAGLAECGSDAAIRQRGSLLYVLGRDPAVLRVVLPHGWRTIREWPLGTRWAQDVAVASARRAYVTAEGQTRLLRVDPMTGAISQGPDLSVFADADGVPDLGMMTIDGERLIVQVRRLNENEPYWFAAPAMLAVVDLRTEQIVDADPSRPGVQAIELAGTPPKHRMQIVGRKLFVSATGGFHDPGGLEVVNLDTLKSEGLVVRESDGRVGADLGPFVMVSPERGYLSFSMDWVESSYLVEFSLGGGVGDQFLIESLGYMAPTMAFDEATGLLCFPIGGWSGEGVHVLDSSTNTVLTDAPIGVGGVPRELVIVR
ncbi:MAG TPA: hypothetical protein VFF69_15520 [Phycisphaerales bacterium]|nr:hypothetical protein [Phycisphaerales bacterium]